MRVLVASLQVSESGSKGHLHPALEIALECKRRGHSPFLLPLPSPLGPEDRCQLEFAGVTCLEPPPVPTGVLKTPAELGALAADPENAWQAYRSFLVEPLFAQFAGVSAIVESLRPDVILYDLLVYAAPLAARIRGIPDLGFCAGLKLLAPEEFQECYRGYRARIAEDLEIFLSTQRSAPRFHHLELLSDHGQLVFATPGLVGDLRAAPSGTRLAGALPVSTDRGDSAHQDFGVRQEGDFAVVSFGSVLDPADFPAVLAAISQVTRERGLRLLIGSRKLAADPARLPAHARAVAYLPLPALLSEARIFFHHGGANSFSEALRAGTPQILIPLTTDQPIQAHYLNASGVGFAVAPGGLCADTLAPRVARLLDPQDEIQAKIARMAQDLAASNGASFAVDALEKLASRGAEAKRTDDCAGGEAR